MAFRIDSGKRGFTLIELLVVLAIMAALLTLVVPRYFERVDTAKETVLRHDLMVMREAIDKFQADRGRYPKSLDELAQQRYIREVPLDPITNRRDTWQIVRPEKGEGVFDVRSGADGKGGDGKEFKTY
ncbi:prepilin-type N-terminal cleavage/methylation domain-containing protein [Niveibacterium umoris]|uniref:General secretion pathway protein G n=1 Tax=Niveibacterium umoris TaxID=1193620 RepID=A0A840BGP8_9RHOO|nr:prepilin-type N-terminal cleavage/methylation domain-containing protein [Niveibacterium umoris]MBB4010799.1 general secretion pathway protein G [Niveibacterium umoris]